MENNAPETGTPSSPEELDTLLNDWFSEFQEKQRKLMDRYGIGSEGDYLLHESECVLEFSRNKKPYLQFEIVPIGSWSDISETWKWSFQDQRYPKTARQSLATTLETVGQMTGLDIFVEEEAFGIEFENAELLIGSVVHSLGAHGAYSVPSVDGTLRAYYAIVSENLLGNPDNGN